MSLSNGKSIGSLFYCYLKIGLLGQFPAASIATNSIIQLLKNSCDILRKEGFLSSALANFLFAGV
jgi:hypothetical protein